MAELLGYGEGFGRAEIKDAIRACLEDAGIFPEQVGSAWVASVNDLRSLVEGLRWVGVTAPVVRPSAPNLYSASFPMAVAEAARQAANGSPAPVLIVGGDCLAGASAALVRRGGRA
jgi:hypothetical protein